MQHHYKKFNYNIFFLILSFSIFIFNKPTVAVPNNSVDQLSDNHYSQNYKIDLLSGTFPSNAKSVSVGFEHTCAISDEDKLYCWGKNTNGQLGDGTNEDKSAPTLVNNNGLLGNLKIISVSTYLDHTCAINTKNNLYCWGYNSTGSLGNGTVKNSTTPILVKKKGLLDGNKVINLSAGGVHTCAISLNEHKEKKLYCWGWNAYGQLGDGTVKQKLKPVIVNKNGFLGGYSVKSISAGTYHTCAINIKDQLYCWGHNGFGELGTGESTHRALPKLIMNGVSNVSAANWRTCAVDNKNNLYCWGINDSGQLGDGTNESRFKPTLVNNLVNTLGISSSKKFTSVSAGDFHTCAINIEGRLFCWGNNGNGQLGNGTKTNRTTPSLVNNNGLLGGYEVSSVSTSYDYTCAINIINQLYCWGKNNKGQLGDGTKKDKLTPTLISNVLINDPLEDYILINGTYYKRSDYNKSNNELTKKKKPLPSYVIIRDPNKKIEVLMEKYTIGANLKKRLKQRVIRIYGISIGKPKLKVYYNYTISPIKYVKRKLKVISKIAKRNYVKIKGFDPGVYKIRYKVVVQTIVNKKPVIVWSNKSSDLVEFIINEN